LQPFFAEWSTSLIGSSLARLKSLSKDDRLRRLVKTLVIEDDCERLDPWMTGDFPQVNALTSVWPRNNTGNLYSPKYIVTAGHLDVGISDLAHLLRERLFRPRRIRVRDYHIDPANVPLCPEMERVRELAQVASPAAEGAVVSVRVDALAKKIIECSNLSVTYLEMRSVDIGAFPPVSWDSLASELGGTISLACPRAEEATIELIEDYSGQETAFSMLRSADILIEYDAATYWLEQIFYGAPNLKTLSLTVQQQSPGPWLALDCVVPALREFTLSQVQTAISTQDLLAMLASSKESLTHLDLRSIKLTRGAWRDVLSLLANEYRNLRSFKFDRLREEKGMVFGKEEPCFCTLDFGDTRDHLPEAYRPGLNLIEKPRYPHKPMCTLTYDGPNAGPVLHVLALQGKPGDFRNPHRPVVEGI
jgi:hypothetical protein